MNLSSEEVSSLAATIDSATIGATSTVTFTVKDLSKPARGAVGLTAGAQGNVRFAIAKLNPGVDGNPSQWKSYVNRTAGTAPTQATQATADRTGTLVDNRDGTYKYTFAADLTAQKDPVTQEAIPFEPTKTHRLVLQLSGNVNGVPVAAVNAIKDFVPSGAAVTETRLIIETKSCNECHGKIVAHGSRYESGYCVVCHNSSNRMPGETRNVLDMSFMTHGIHSAGFRASRGAPEFAVGEDSFAEVTYPQELNHCKKCHEASAAAPQGDNWKNVPNKNSCGGCHESTRFNDHVSRLENSMCSSCHGANSTILACGPTNDASCAIASVHATDNPTQNNTEIVPGLYKIDYDIKSVSVDGANKAVITFRILKNGAPLNFATDLGDLTGGPTFLLAYSMPQDGITPIDYNNVGRPAAQPITVSLADLRSGAQGTLSGPDGEGYYTAVTNATFPAGSSMRAVSLQGYFSQTGVPGRTGAVARHTISKVATAASDTARREVVDSAKCSNCHEWFEAHGGNRVYEVQVCVMCHNPNLSTSGRAADPATLATRLSAADAARLAAAGFDPANPLTWPEAPHNFRELIHSIHASDMRTNDFQFVRDRGNSGVFYYDMAEVTFPGELNNCETCHKPNTYGTALPERELASTQMIPGTTGDRAGIVAARASVPNTADLVTTPTAASCSGCHDNPLAQAHMKLTGALIRVTRDVLPSGVETCNICHGAGRLADTAVIHKP